LEGLSQREIAELLNQPAGTVKANVHRGVQLLRGMLEKQAKETG
jgi:DNA-directed RNA polymerase specialized sigma24 family protein